MHAQLRVISGPFAGETLRIDRPKFIIGREQDCQLRPNSEFVSRHHCVILLDDYTLRIRDLGSKNGTIVNGHRIMGELILCHDDMISLGEISLQVDLLTEAPPAAETTSQSLNATDVFEGNTVTAGTADTHVDEPSPKSDQRTQEAAQDETSQIPQAKAASDQSASA